MLDMGDAGSPCPSRRASVRIRVLPSAPPAKPLANSDPPVGPEAVGSRKLDANGAMDAGNLALAIAKEEALSSPFLSSPGGYTKEAWADKEDGGQEEHTGPQLTNSIGGYCATNGGSCCHDAPAGDSARNVSKESKDPDGTSALLVPMERSGCGASAATEGEPELNWGWSSQTGAVQLVSAASLSPPTDEAAGSLALP